MSPDRYAGLQHQTHFPLPDRRLARRLWNHGQPVFRVFMLPNGGTITVAQIIWPTRWHHWAWRIIGERLVARFQYRTIEDDHWQEMTVEVASIWR